MKYGYELCTEFMAFSRFLDFGCFPGSLTIAWRKESQRTLRDSLGDFQGTFQQFLSVSVKAMGYPYDLFKELVRHSEGILGILKNRVA